MINKTIFKNKQLSTLGTI